MSENNDSLYGYKDAHIGQAIMKDHPIYSANGSLSANQNVNVRSPKNKSPVLSRKDQGSNGSPQ